MKLQIKINTQEDAGFDKAWFRKISQQVFEFLNKEGNFLFNINLVNENQIQAINNKFRHKDQPTTILTFVDKDIKEKFINPENDYQSLGSIFLCPSQIRKQAKTRYKISTKELMTRMLIHGILHLLEYTHENEEKASLMEEKEDFLINQLEKFS
jgi:probable rRNA maturation factor